MSYLPPNISGAPVDNTVADWHEKGSTTGGVATATHAAEAGKSHYICGIAFACQGQTTQDPDEMTCELTDDTTGIWKVSFQSVAINDNTPGGDATKLLTFPHPIKITAGNQTKLVVTGATGYAVAYANIWGFTV